AADDLDFSVRQYVQGRPHTSGVHRIRGRKAQRVSIKYFRGFQALAGLAQATGEEHLSVAQQDSGVKTARRGQSCLDRGEFLRSEVEDLRAPFVIAAGDEQPAVGEHGGGV